MSVALFDLDNTLLGGDSDYLWGQYLVAIGVVDRDTYENENKRFYALYEAGNLDIHEFLDFALRPLATYSRTDLETWREDFLHHKIRPILLPKAQALVERHRAAGDTLAIITATNRFVTGPIAGLFGVDTLLATEPELVDGQYTGQVKGTPCFQAGKVECLRQWLNTSGESLENSWCYSDSANDLPLLEQVSHPVAVDPDTRLRAAAEARGWQIVSLR